MQKTWSLRKRLSKKSNKNKARLHNSYFPPQRFRRKIYYEEVSDEEDGELMEDLEEKMRKETTMVEAYKNPSFFKVM